MPAVDAEFEVFRSERRGSAAIVWLDRPEKLNAMAPVFFRERRRSG
jgi:enoyl-CoA hydratase/carnithine racemase